MKDFKINKKPSIKLIMNFNKEIKINKSLIVLSINNRDRH